MGLERRLLKSDRQVYNLSKGYRTPIALKVTGCQICFFALGGDGEWMEELVLAIHDTGRYNTLQRRSYTAGAA